MIARRQLLKAAGLGVPLLASGCGRDTADLLTVGCNTSFLPFEFRSGDRYTGFDIDLWAMLAAALERRWTLQPMDFTGLIPALQTGNIDVALSGLFIRPDRARVIAFSNPYYMSGLSALVRIDEDRILGTADLSRRIVAVETGNGSVSFLSATVPTAEVREFPNINNAILALQAKRVDAVVHDTPTLLFYARTAGRNLVRTVQPPLKSGEPYGFGFPLGSPLVGPVNRELSVVRADGRYDRLYRQWFGTAPSATSRRAEGEGK